MIAGTRHVGGAICSNLFFAVYLDLLRYDPFEVGATSTSGAVVKFWNKKPE